MFKGVVGGKCILSAVHALQLVVNDLYAEQVGLFLWNVISGCQSLKLSEKSLAFADALGERNL